MYVVKNTYRPSKKTKRQIRHPFKKTKRSHSLYIRGGGGVGIEQCVNFINSLTNEKVKLDDIDCNALIKEIKENFNNNIYDESGEDEDTFIIKNSIKLKQIESYISSISHYNYKYDYFSGTLYLYRNYLLTKQYVNLQDYTIITLHEKYNKLYSTFFTENLNYLKKNERINELLLTIGTFKYNFTFNSAVHILGYSIKKDGYLLESAPIIFLRFGIYVFNIFEEIHNGDINDVNDANKQGYIDANFDEYINDIITTFNYLNDKKFIVPAPALAYGGTIEEKGATCFLVGKKLFDRDDLIDIGKEISDLYFGASGIYMHETPVNHIINYAKVLNIIHGIKTDNHFRHPTQVFYIEPWNKGIHRLLDLKDPLGSDESTIRNTHIGIYMPDEFMRCVEYDLDWYLFDNVNGDISLADFYGDEFVKKYNEYISDVNIKHEKIKARELWNKIISTQLKSGEPYILYKDSINRKSNENHIGKKVIRGSNLCCEVVQYTDEEYTASCCVMTMSALAFFDDNEKKMDWVEFRKAAVFLQKLADNLAGKIKNVLSERAIKSQDFRSTGIGLNGVTNVIFKYNYDFDSEDAVRINRELYENLYYGILQGSVETSKKKGSYRMFSGSKYNQGKLQYDLWDEEQIQLFAEKGKLLKVLVLPDYKKFTESQDKIDFLLTYNYEKPVFDNNKEKINYTINKEKLLELVSNTDETKDEYGTPNMNNKIADFMISICCSRYHLNVDKDKLSIPEWADLKTQIMKNGLRNSQLSSQPPSVAGSIFLETIPGAEPLTSNLFTTKTASGANWMLNQQLIDDLTDNNVNWLDVLDNIKANRGSVQKLENVKTKDGNTLDETILNKIKTKYRTVWELMESENGINNICTHSRERGRFLDQSEAFNVFLRNPDGDSVNKCHFNSWRYGLKTGVYYLKMRPAREAIQFTVSKDKTNPITIMDAQQDLRKKNPLLHDDRVYTMFPITYLDVWDYYKKLELLTWKAEEIEFMRDRAEFLKLDEPTKKVIKEILTFFSVSDGLVGENLVENFMKDVEMKEAIKVYTSQALQESVHEEVYGRLIENLIEDPIERDKLFTNWVNKESIKKKVFWGELFSEKDFTDTANLSEWEKKFLNEIDLIKQNCLTTSVSYENEEEKSREVNFTVRLIGIACLEGIMFSSSFAFIYYLSSVRGLKNMVGLIGSNEFIARDEGLHRDFAVFLYNNYINHKLSEECIHSIISIATEVETQFIEEILPPNGLDGLPKSHMIDYIKVVADNLAESLNYNKIYNVKNPLKWMDMISTDSKTDQFFKRSNEYQNANAKISYKGTQSCIGCSA